MSGVVLEERDSLAFVSLCHTVIQMNVRVFVAPSE